MTMIHISSQLANKLSRIAQRDNKSLDEVAQLLLENQTAAMEFPLEADAEVEPGTGAALLKAAQNAHFRSGRHDVSSRSRDILDHEIPTYLRDHIG